MTQQRAPERSERHLRHGELGDLTPCALPSHGLRSGSRDIDATGPHARPSRNPCQSAWDTKRRVSRHARFACARSKPASGTHYRHPIAKLCSREIPKSLDFAIRQRISVRLAETLKTGLLPERRTDPPTSREHGCMKAGTALARIADGVLPPFCIATKGDRKDEKG